MANYLIRGHFKPQYPPILQFNLKTGRYTIMIEVSRVLVGPPLASLDNHFGTRVLELVIQLVHPDAEGNSVITCKVQDESGGEYTWPSGGRLKPAVARFKRTSLDGQAAVRLIALEAQELIGYPQ